MKLTVGKTTFEIQNDLIDCEDFAETAFRIAPKSIHVREGELTGRMNWQPDDLKNIGFALKSYPAVKAIAEQAGCNATSTLAKRLAEAHLSKEHGKVHEDGTRITFEEETKFAIHDIALHLEVLGSVSINPPNPEKEQKLWDEIEAEIDDG